MTVHALMANTVKTFATVLNFGGTPNQQARLTKKVTAIAKKLGKSPDDVIAILRQLS